MPYIILLRVIIWDFFMGEEGLGPRKSLNCDLFDFYD